LRELFQCLETDPNYSISNFDAIFDSCLIQKFMYQKIFLLSYFVSATLFFCEAQTVPERTGSKINRAEAQEALDFHNKSRKEVSVPTLEWSAELATYAQEWADYLAANNNCKMEHRSNMKKATKQAGENLFWGSASIFTPLDASKSWYSEISDYVYSPVSPQNFHKTGHYTQMIWKSTREVGIGISQCPDGAVIIVSNYFPPGNYIGEKPY
jgi:hypothetical protein